MLIFWISVFFLAEPLLVVVFGLAMTYLSKDVRPEIPRFVPDLVLMYHIVIIVMLCLELSDALGSRVDAALVLLGLFVARMILRPIVFGTLDLLLAPRGEYRSYPTVHGRPWVNPGSDPPPGWND